MLPTPVTMASHDARRPGEHLERWPTEAIPGLRIHDGFRCLRCEPGSAFLTRDLPGMHRHISKQHQEKPSAHKMKQRPVPWEACKLQTFFSEPGAIRYFVVRVGGEAGQAADAGEGGASDLDAGEASFFRSLDDDAKAADEDAKAGARVVEGFDGHRSAVVPWLGRIGIADHLRGLDKGEIQAAFAVPRKGDDISSEEPELGAILDGMDEVLTETHRWCFDGPECRLTWPRQLALSRFRTSDSVTHKMRGFDPKKARSTVNTNFLYWKQLLSFYFHVIHRGGHFAKEDGTQTPEDCIRPTKEQRTAWDAVWRLARAGNDKGALKQALLTFSMALLCHDYGSHRYRSVVLSFAAMHSVEVKTRAWRPAGSFSSFLSGLVWAAQLVVFRASVGAAPHGGGGDDDDDDDDGGRHGILATINTYCKRYMRPDRETPMGEILGWRLLCRAVARDDVGRHQAAWDEDGQGLTYGDVHLRLDDVRTLFTSEMARARRLLYDELLFGADALPRLQASALKDDLSRTDVGWFFGRRRDNQAVLGPLDRALEGVIRSSAPLRNAYLDRSGQTVTWRAKAIAYYEAVVDDFLTTCAPLFHMAPGQALREAELFSILWKNTQRHRSIGLKHGRVMVHTTYHKGQQQTGKYKDNIRFLPAALGDLLIDYLVYVVPLVQAFARHAAPGTVVSPYLWTRDGRVWTDNRLTRCMEKACARAAVPRLHIANWRQMTVSIVKTKFSKEDARCFAIGDGHDEDDEDAEEVDDDVRVMTKQRNHGTPTVNRAYSNQQGASFGGVWDGLVRQGLRASVLWHGLWDLDRILAPAPAPDRKRRGAEAGLGPGGPDLVKRIAMGTYRRRAAWTSKALLQHARMLYKDDAVQWRSPVQERAMRTVMSRAEQVVVVMATGEGKSLLFMLPCVLPDAGVTILVVPLVSLWASHRTKFKEFVRR
ncbi:hypothetical protein ACHAQH_009227 [Verticillium albo-atrum]